MLSTINRVDHEKCDMIMFCILCVAILSYVLNADGTESLLPSIDYLYSNDYNVITQPKQTIDTVNTLNDGMKMEGSLSDHYNGSSTVFINGILFGITCFNVTCMIIRRERKKFYRNMLNNRHLHP